MFKYFFRSEYAIKARFIPAVITFVPMGVLFWLMFAVNHPGFLDNFKEKVAQHCSVLSKGLVFVGMIYLWSLVMRISAKYVESVVFKNELYFPTTTLLLLRDEKLPVTMKLAVRGQLKREFKIELMSEDEEDENEVEARKLVAIAVKKMRDKMRDGRVVLQYNILYGFARNATIGSFYSLLCSVAIFAAGCSCGSRSAVVDLGVMLSLLYLLVLLLARPLWRYTGNLYATNLINEYFGSERIV